MARLSGISHAGAALGSTILAAVLIHYLEPAFPGLFMQLERAGGRIANWVLDTTGILLPPAIFLPAFVACVIAFFWGVCYHVMRFRE